MLELEDSDLECRSLVMEPINSLADVAIFSRIEPEGLEFLAARFNHRKFRRNEVIFHQDDSGDRLYVVTSGLVKIVIVSEDGRENDIALHFPGDCFGEMSVLDGGRRSATAVAVEPTETVTLSREAFLEFLDDHPKVAVHIISLLVQRLRVTDDLIGDMIFLDVPTRVAKKLLELAEINQDGPDQKSPVTILLTHEELGRMVGATREVVSRALINYRRQGLITTSRRKIVIKDVEELERITAL